MKKFFAAISLALSAAMLFAPVAGAQEKKELTAQQKRMGECSSKAKGLKGDEYKKVRDECLKGSSDEKSDKKALTPQQQKMADCNAKAKGLKGEEYKKMRDTCLKG
jgi:hypothetical protein